MIRFVMLTTIVAAALAQTPPSATSPDPNMARPIDAVDSVFIEELTWMEVRDAMRAGKRTAIVATGGVEMNGPYLATGKHNYILRATTEAIARKLGDALVAPIVAFVPEGDIDPPTSHMRYPGSISVTEATFQSLLTDIAASLKTNGFEHIIFLSDSGGNVAGMKAVASKLSSQWRGKPTIHYIAEYYDYPGLTKWLETQGIHQTNEGHHDDYGISSLVIVADPAAARTKQRIAKGKFSINGVSLAPVDKTVAMGKKAVEYRAGVAVGAIRKALASR